MPVSDSASCQIVRRKFQRYPIAVHHFDAIAPEFPGHGRQHGRPYVELNGEHARTELLDDLA